MKPIVIAVSVVGACALVAAGASGSTSASADAQAQPVEKVPEITYSQYAEAFSQTAQCIETATNAPATASVDTTQPWRISPQQPQTRLAAGTDKKITDCILANMMSAGIAGDQHWWGPQKQKTIDMGDCPKPAANKDPYLACIEHYHGATLAVIPVSSGKSADEAAQNLEKAQRKPEAAR